MRARSGSTLDTTPGSSHVRLGISKDRNVWKLPKHGKRKSSHTKVIAIGSTRLDSTPSSRAPPLYLVSSSSSSPASSPVNTDRIASSTAAIGSPPGSSAR